MKLEADLYNFKPVDATAGPWRRWLVYSGPVLAILLAIGLSLGSRAGLELTVPSSLFLLVIAFASLTGGMLSGLISTAIGLAYYVFELATPDGLFTANQVGFENLIVLAIIGICMVLIVGLLKRQSEQANRRALELVRQQNTLLEERVQQRTGQLEEILKRLPVGVAIAEAPSGRILLGNDYMAQVWRHDVVVANAVNEYESYRGFHTDNRPYLPEEWPLARAVTSGEVVHEEEIYTLRGDGTCGTMLVNAAPIRNAAGEITSGVVTFLDISERKKAEREREDLLKQLATQNELAQTNLQQLQAIIQNMNEGLVLIDGTGQIRLINPVGQKLFDLPSSEEVESGVEELSSVFKLYDPTNDRLLDFEEWPVKRMLRGESFTNFELRVTRRDHPLSMTASYSGTPIYNAQGQVSLAVMTIRDVTEQRQAQERLGSLVVEREKLLRELENRAMELEDRVRERTRRLEEANRYKSQFLSQMSHELRTPLNSILGFTTILLRQLPGPLNPEQTKQLELVRGSAQQLLSLISGLLDLARIEAGKISVKYSEFNPLTVLKTAVESVRPLAEAKHLALNIELAAPEIATCRLYSDEVKYKQILLNLLSNAIKFTDQGGVTVELDRIAGPGGQWLKVIISDTGIGIAPDKIHHLFEEFAQLEEAGTRRAGGSGLGLALTRRLVELLGGRVDVTSEIGQGSAFSVYLPVGDC